MASATVRVREQTRETLRALCSQMDRTMSELLDEAVELYRRRVFVAEANAAFERLRANAQEWRKELEERAEWDCAARDGLED